MKWNRGLCAFAIAIGAVGTLSLSANAASPKHSGPGAISVTPKAIAEGRTDATLVFNYVAPPAGLTNGEVGTKVPKGWTPPQITDSSAAGFVTTSTGTLAIYGSQISVSGLDLCGSCIASFTYGDVTVPAKKKKYTFITSAGDASSQPKNLAVEPKVSVVPATAPDAPTGVSATPGNTTAQVTWTAPQSDGNSPISGYSVLFGSTVVATTTGATSVQVTGLTNGDPYSFTVQACNAIGCGTTGGPSNEVTPIGPPGQPQFKAAVINGTSITWSWSDIATAANPISGYDVSLDGTLIAADSSQTSYTQSFGDSTPHTLTVAAVNGGGEGPSSSDTEQTSVSPPGAPTFTSVSLGFDGAISWSWSDGASHGSPITGYNIYLDGSLIATDANQTNYSATFGYSQTHSLTVAGVNEAGAGPSSSYGVTIGPPEETTGVAAKTWTNYSNAGGTRGPNIPAFDTVQISCKVQGFKVVDGNTWWYRIAQSPWNNVYYVSADAFYNNGQTSGSLKGTPFVDPYVPNC